MPYYEEKIASETVYSGKVFTVTKDQVRLKNGKEATREVVHHSGGAAVLALNKKGQIALVRQFRYGKGQEMIELPAGKIEPGESPKETARRELIEEAGQKAKNFVSFGQVFPTCAYCTEVVYIFLATDLEDVPQKLDPDEFLDVFWLPLEEAAQMVMDGRIDDAKTVSAVLRARQLYSKWN